jgi:hypothetical protein
MPGRPQVLKRLKDQRMTLRRRNLAQIHLGRTRRYALRLIGGVHTIQYSLLLFLGEVLLKEGHLDPLLLLQMHLHNDLQLQGLALETVF